MKVKTFIDNDVREYSLYTIFQRAIPSFEDGLKPSQRKILYTAFKKNLLKKEMKTIGLIGEIISFTHYHHGDSSLANALANLASDYIPSNNYPLMLGDGFGSRFDPVSASPRYTFIKLSEWFDKLYNHDTDLLDNIKEEKEKIIKDDENNCYDYFTPLIPTTLINGVEGVATGFAVKIYPRKIEDIKKYIDNYIKGKRNKKLIPYYKDFKGTIKYNEKENRYNYTIPFERIDKKTIKIIDVFPATKSEKFIKLLNKYKNEDIIKSYEDKTKEEYEIIIKFKKEVSDEFINDSLKMSGSFATDNVTVIKEGNQLLTYDTIEEYLEDFIDWRLSIYEKRKEYVINILNNKLEKALIELKYINEVNKLDKNKLTKNKLEKIINKIKGTQFKSYLLKMPIYSFTKEDIKDSMSKIKDLKKEITFNKGKEFKEDYAEELKLI